LFAIRQPQGNRYRAIIQGGILPLRRPDGRGLDYTLHVNPTNPEQGLLLVFNPLAEVRLPVAIPANGSTWYILE
jgi:hypothetical protein